MVACRYGISLLVFNFISHLFTVLNCEISSWTLEETFHTVLLRRKLTRNVLAKGYRMDTRTWNILVTEFSESLFFWTSFENIYQWNANKMETRQYRMDSERIRNGYGMDKDWERELVWNGNKMRFVKLSLLAFFWSVLYLCMPMYCSLYIKDNWLNAHVWICTAVQIQN